MSVKRDKERISKTGEHFTPPALTEELLFSLPKEFWSSKDVKILEPAAGEGWMITCIVKKFTHKDIKHILESQIYAVELMFDNCVEIQNRLKNEFGYKMKYLVCADSLSYSMNFKEQDLFNH